jgi:hypothetical protein
MTTTDHKAPRYVVISTPLLPRPSQALMSSSAPYSPTLPAYILPSMWETKFHTHIEQMYIFGYKNEDIIIFWTEL